MADAHWDEVYRTKRADEVSWYQPHLARSLVRIARSALGTRAAVIDVGGGESTLVDDLLALGHTDVTVLDLSHVALDAAKTRLGARADAVTWICGDVTSVALSPARYDVWHDRAVFHFLTEPAQRDAYARQLLHAVRPGGLVVIATFAADGPERCSGLPVARWAPQALARELARTASDALALVDAEAELHVTPAGRTQSFSWCTFDRR
jgi:2-polyprenyl-3-methyl-5-hydroxy-6-metoxy-1,4-benzoquinol methylase